MDPVTTRTTTPGRWHAIPRFHEAGTERGIVRTGILDALPAVAGLAPLALALGAAVSRSPLPALTGWLTAPLIYGASAQFAALSLLGAGAAAISVLLNVAVVNARVLFYSAALRPMFRDQPRWFRFAGPYLLVDPLFALMGARADRFVNPRDTRQYYLAAGLAIWVSWLVMIAAGVALGSAVPNGVALEYAVPALLIGFLVPAIRANGALAAAGVAIAAVALPWDGGGAGLLVAGMAGAAAGAFIDRRGVKR